MINIFNDLVKTIKAFTASPYVIDSLYSTEGVDPRIVAYAAKESRLAEQYRIIQTDLYAIAEAKKVKTIAVTSSQKGEGKTMVCCNLALTISNDKMKKVLLVDCDLRQPSVHTMLNIHKEPGFSDIIIGKANIDDFVRKPAIGNLYAVASGVSVTNAVDILRNSKTKEVVEKFKSVFDYVIFDTPPILPVSDSRILGSLCDSVIMVIKANVTQKDSVSEAMGLLDSAHVIPLSFILTNFRIPPYQIIRHRHHYYEGYEK